MADIDDISKQTQSDKSDNWPIDKAVIYDLNDRGILKPRRSGATRATNQDEQITAERINIFNIKPTWGISKLRDKTVTDGANASVSEVGGEIKVSTGADANSTASIRTIERGHYLPGSELDVGAAVRVANAPTGTQNIQWGYFDDDNGVGFGQNASGTYVFRRKDGVDDKVLQDNWNIDKLDGSGLSDSALDTSNGAVYNMSINWYGYGNIKWYVDAEDVDGDREFTEVHSFAPQGEVSITDPDQPINVECTNGANPGDVTAFIGGRQVSNVGGTTTPNTRSVNEVVRAFTLPSGQNFEHPIIAIRKTPTHGPSNRTNTVKAFFKEAQVVTNETVEVDIRYRATTAGGTFAPPTDWDSNESAIETTTVDDGNFSASSGYSVSRNLVSVQSAGGPASKSFTVSKQGEFPLDNATEVVMFVTALTANSTTIRVMMEWREQW